MEATTVLEERGFTATCSEVKHIVSHTLYHVRCNGEDYVVKVLKE